MILTPRGEVAVERLRAGDLVVLHSGATAAITWVGRRSIALRRHARPETVLPVLIEASSILDGVPRRDLYVSPDHALYLDGQLIPAKALINGRTIRQVEMRTVTYFHIELPRHAVLYAEGTPAESYLETGNRPAFENGGKAMILHPDFAQTLRETTGCAPFAEEGVKVEAIRRQILARSGIATTADPAMSIGYRADGAAVITSRTAVPGHVSPDPRDLRSLGVKIGALFAGDVAIPLDHPALVEGWYGAEDGGRWTNGEAIIPASLLGGATVRVTLSAVAAYPIAEEDAHRDIG